LTSQKKWPQKNRYRRNAICLAKIEAIEVIYKKGNPYISHTINRIFSERVNILLLHARQRPLPFTATGIQSNDAISMIILPCYFNSNNMMRKSARTFSNYLKLYDVYAR